MDWGAHFSDLNWWAVLGATASSFVVGFVWYHWNVMGKKWAGLVGLSKKEMDNPDNMTETYVMTAISSFVVSLVMALLMHSVGSDTWQNGLLFGAIVGFAFRFGTHVMHNGFARRSKELTWVDGTHDVIALAVAGAILGQWL